MPFFICQVGLMGCNTNINPSHNAVNINQVHISEAETIQQRDADIATRSNVALNNVALDGAR